MTTYKETLEKLELESFCKFFDTSLEEIQAAIREHEESLQHPKTKDQLAREIDEVLEDLEAKVIPTVE